MCVKKIVCLAMCVKKIDCRQPADLYIKKLLKKLKEDQNFSSLRQQFHLIGLLSYSRNSRFSSASVEQEFT